MTDERKTKLIDEFLGWMIEHHNNDEDLFHTLHTVIGMTKEELNDFSIESLDVYFDKAVGEDMLKKLTNYCVNEGTEHSEDGNWAISYNELYYHFGVDVNDTNGNGKALADELKKRDEIAELIMTEDCIEINFHLQYCENCQNGNPASVLSLIGCNIYDEHLDHEDTRSEKTDEIPKVKLKAFDKEWELLPEVTAILVPDFMGREQLNIGINLYTEDENGLKAFAELTKHFNEFIGQKNCAYVDTNNCPYADQLLEQGIAIDTGLTKQSGYCSYPLWLFNEDFLKSVNSKIYDLYSESFDEYMESMHSSEDEGQTFGM